jgi:prepilin-type N-terminal cleavage/methylation domain-containing protein
MIRKTPRGFTLIELLVVIAIIAILAAILFPVFAKAKASAKKTASLSGIKQIALALQMYSTDYDDMAVPEYGSGATLDPNPYHNNSTWVGKVMPYVKNRGVFWDKMLPDPKEDGTLPSGEKVFIDPFFGPGYEYRWEWVTNFSLNTDGYSRHWSGPDCKNINWSGQGTHRSLTTFEDPAGRLAVAVTRYAHLPWSWMRFYAIDAAWPTMDRYANGWSWYQLIWDARKEYEGPRFIGAFTDGHAGKFGREKFVGYYIDTPGQTEANTYDEFCDVMDAKKLWSFWGRAWSGD